MAPKGIDAGKQFLEQILAKSTKLTADQKAAILADETILDEVGNGTLMRSEASRIADELRTESERVAGVARQQSAWWTTNKPRLDKVEELERRIAEGSGAKPGLDEAAVDERIGRMAAEIENSGLAVTAIASEISVGHLHEFGERLNMRELFNNAVKAKQPLDAFYNAQVADRRQKRADEVRAKELADAKEAGRKEGLAAAMNREAQPYPVSDSSGPSTLSGLRKPTDAKVNDEYSLEAAIKTATEVMAGAGSGATG